MSAEDDVLEAINEAANNVSDLWYAARAPRTQIQIAEDIYLRVLGGIIAADPYMKAGAGRPDVAKALHSASFEMTVAIILKMNQHKKQVALAEISLGEMVMRRIEELETIKE